MLYRPKTISKMWDTWLYWHQGAYYLYYLATERSPGEGIGLARSSDGVHWQEVGPILDKAPDAQWLGTGSVWPLRNNEQTYVMNFSEWRGPEMLRGQQTIFFATSPDLVHWTRQQDTEFAPDPRWYRRDEDENSRWDCIYGIPRGDGGYYGYWTANPKDFHTGFGFGESDDGVHWQALEPPTIAWEGVTPPPVLEVGGVERIGHRYFALLGAYRRYGHYNCGMYLFAADAPQGPFSPVAGNFAVLASPHPFQMSYFARFFPSPDGMLVNHQVMSRADERAFAPLKRARVGTDGIMRLTYWSGNEALKGSPRPVLSAESVAAGNYVFRWLTTSFDTEQGLVWEGTIDVRNEPADGLALRHADGTLTVIRCIDPMTVTFSEIRAGLETLVDEVQRAWSFPHHVQFRLLLRGPFIELYLDDILIQCHSLVESPIERLGFVGGIAERSFDASGGSVRFWQMTLSE